MRLAQKEKQVLKELGVETIEQAKANLAELKKLEQERMTETERLKARVAELEPIAKERDEYKGAIAARAAQELAALSPEQRAAVEGIASTPSAQLKAIETLRPTWAKAAAPIAAPASTTPAPSAPPAASTTSGPNHYEVWQSLKKTNPIAAASYLDLHQVEIVNLKNARP
jgi:hypothetical protein